MQKERRRTEKSRKLEFFNFGIFLVIFDGSIDEWVGDR